MTKAEIKRRSKPIKLKVRKGDQVVIIAGKNKGEVGFIAAVDPKNTRVIVLKNNPDANGNPIPLNAVIKHRKARQQGERSARLTSPAPLHISNVMLLDPKTGLATRIGKKEVDGKLVRYAKKSGEKIIDAPVMGDNK